MFVKMKYGFYYFMCCLRQKESGLCVSEKHVILRSHYLTELKQTVLLVVCEWLVMILISLSGLNWFALFVSHVLLVSVKQPLEFKASENWIFICNINIHKYTNTFQRENLLITLVENNCAVPALRISDWEQMFRSFKGSLDCVMSPVRNI